ncbi:MAG: helix-turn-helix domain-containing protein [Alphaproteobacteria bacterium]
MTFEDKTLPGAVSRVRCHHCVVRSDGFCGAVSCRQLSHLDRISHSQTFARQQSLFYEGDPATAVFNVAEGVVRLTKLLADGRRAVVGFVYPGSFLGLSATATHGYSAEAVTAVGTCRFARARLEAACAEMPELQHRLREMTSRELMAARNRMLTLGRKSLRERMATFLLELAEQDRGGDPEVLSMPMSRSDVADYLGLTIETVSRCLTGMTRDSLIELPDKRSVRVHNWVALRRLADGERADGG